MLRDDPASVRATRLLIARRVAQARLDADLTQQQVADAVGRGQGWVSDTEGGLRRLDVVELLALAKVLRRPAGWFMRDPDPGEEGWMRSAKDDLLRISAKRRGP